jgi:hypothetical protein
MWVSGQAIHDGHALVRRKQPLRVGKIRRRFHDGLHRNFILRHCRSMIKLQFSVSVLTWEGTRTRDAVLRDIGAVLATNG